MVGYLMLLKLLHCRQENRRRKKLILNRAIAGQGSSANVSVKIENDVTEVHTCRICLKEGSIPIFGTNGSEDFAEPVATFGGIELNIQDDFPKYLCQACHNLLQSAMLLRKKAQQSDERLRQQCEMKTDDSDTHDYGDEDLKYNPEHKEVKYSQNNDVHRCETCNLDFKSFQEYADHRLSPEHENMRYTCHICNKTYKRVYYKRHMALHSEEVVFMCDICGKKFKIQGQFARHRLTHFNDLPFKCTLCPYRGRFTESLRMHMRSHTGERPYPCSLCPAKFVSKSNLNRHMLTHKPDHDFKCDTCGRGFYTKRCLELHFKVAHTGLKEHVCNICGKSFGYRKQMMKHQLKVHKREKFKSGRQPLYLRVDSKEIQTGGSSATYQEMVPRY